jgi:hypothetical protein
VERDRGARAEPLALDDRIAIHPIEDLNVGSLDLAEPPFPMWGGDLSLWE